MAVDHQSKAKSTILDAGLALYRRTLKRLRPVHIGIHWLMTRTLIPLLETLTGFHTMPDDPFWFRLELLIHRHEAETRHHFRRLIQPGMTVLDVGAHVGYYTRIASRLIGENGRVVCFEPHPRNRGFLENNTTGASNVDILSVAAAEQEGTAELYDYLMMSASGSLHYDESLRDVQRQQLTESDYSPRIAAGHQVEKFTVRTAPIDDCLQELGISTVDLVKMDIEGAELGALRGMKRTIAQSPGLSLIMEYNPMGLRAFEHEPEAVIDEIMQMGFVRVQVIQPGGGLSDITDNQAEIRRLTDELTGNMGVVNLLFTQII